MNLKMYFLSIMFVFLTNKGCKDDSNLEVCDGKYTETPNVAISFKPILLPVEFEYDSNEGLSVSAVGSFNVGVGTVTISTDIYDSDSPHRVKLILINNSANGWGEKVYYIKNTDKVKVIGQTYGDGEFIFETNNDVITIDLSKYQHAKFNIWINNFYNPESGVNNLYKVTTTQLFVRTSPGKRNDNKYGTVNYGDEVNATGKYEYVEGRKWIQVCHDGYKLWVSTKYLK